MGVEPISSPWKGDAQPLSQPRLKHEGVPGIEPGIAESKSAAVPFGYTP